MNNTNVSYFYLRHLKYCGGSHRFACIAISKVDAENYRLSFYMHNPKNGPFVAHVARTAAVGRLNSERKSQLVHRSKFEGWGLILMDAVGITRIIVRAIDNHRYAGVDRFDMLKCQEAIRGGLSQLDSVNLHQSA